MIESTPENALDHPHWQYYETILCNSPRELLTKVRLSNLEWNPIPNEQSYLSWERIWIFRGQSDATWLLTPSAWRKGDSKPNSIEIGKARYRSEIEYVLNNPLKRGVSDELKERIFQSALQIFTELHIIKDFALFADQLGYLIPINEIPNFTREFSYELVNSISNIDVENSVLYASKGIHTSFWQSKAIAFAQHHGIPTRFLDWTRNPLFAIYFAVEDAIKNPPASTYMALYAYQTWYFDTQFSNRALTQNVQLIRLPQSEHSFMRSQAGLFTVDMEAEKFFLNYGEYPDLMSSFIVGDPPHPKPKRFLLKTEHAPELLRLLYIEGITRAHLQPTLDNVAKTVNLRWETAPTISKSKKKRRSENSD